MAQDSQQDGCAPSHFIFLLVSLRSHRPSPSGPNVSRLPRPTSFGIRCTPWRYARYASGTASSPPSRHWCAVMSMRPTWRPA